MLTPLLPESARRPAAYFKRFRMEIDLNGLPQPELPDGYSWQPWSPEILDQHADILFRCFQDEIDSAVFASLSNRAGCFCLMNEIARKSGFQPEATWLLTSERGHCGTVQGIRERNGMGAIQNLGITSAHRGRGLGTALLLQCLHGFYRAGLGRAMLEVTARNDGAIRLYQRLGFRRCKTIYKAAPSGGIPIAS